MLNIKKNSLPICFATNEKYLPYCGVTIQSILCNIDVNDKFAIYILHNGISEQKFTKILSMQTDNVSIQFIDVRPYLKNVHCTIMPSYHEGMSNVNLESAANGRPVITTNVPGCRETVDDGLSGYYCEPKSSESLIAAVKRFITMPWEEKKKMGENGRKKVEKEFDRNIVIKAYLDAINKL